MMILKAMPNLVFPAHAGVFLVDAFNTSTNERLPRAHGGGSQGLDARLVTPEFFPAHAGVFHDPQRVATIEGVLPRARGGVSG